MIAQEVAHKYASALFRSAQQRGLTDQAYDQFDALAKTIKSDASLLGFLKSPKISDDQKKAVVQDIFGSRMDQLFVEFLIVLVKKRRARYLLEIIDELNRQIEFQKGIHRATVITAVPLADDEERNLIPRLQAKSGGTVQLEKKVDPAIMGGMIVILHDQIIDGSVRHGLSLVQESLQKVKVH